MRGVNFTAYQKRKALKMWLIEKIPTPKVCQKCKCTERSLWRWKSKYDGTLESLEPKSCRPITPHPNSHTQAEINDIIYIFNNKPNITYNEAYGILRAEHAYNRSYGGFYNYVLRHKIRPRKEIEKYVPKPYDTPEMLGTKWQMDVKFVPTECYKGEVLHHDDKKFFQYTIIDEATRERFLFPYKEHCVVSTIDFVKRAIAYFGYIPQTIQTDNGVEFTYVRKAGQKEPRKHPLDMLCDKLNIKHQLIRAYTPRLNGKVERSHRSDQEGFYNYLTFNTLSELKSKMMEWNIRYNNRPHSSLRNRDGKRVWMTPIQKREDLLLLLAECKEEYDSVRFLQTKKNIDDIYIA